MMLSKYYVSFIALFLLGCSSFDAQPYDTEKECWGSYEEVGSELSLTPSSSMGATTFGEDDEGKLWKFVSAPIPGDFKEVNPAFEILIAPDCQ